MALHKKILELKSKVGSTPFHKSSPVKMVDAIRSASDYENRVLKQYFCLFGVEDDTGVIPIKGCFSKSLAERGPSSSAPYKITALYMHRQGDSVGLPLILKEDEIGLYGEVPILEGIQVCDELVIRHKAGVCNNGSYGFNFVWEKMEYDSTTDKVLMKECNLFEVSFVTIGSQTDTYGVRSATGGLIDDDLTQLTEEFIRKVPRSERLQLRSIIDRHISLAKNQPLNTDGKKALKPRKPKQGGLDYDYLLRNI